MGIRNMPWEDWIQLDNKFPSFHAIRTFRAEQMGEECVRTMPALPGVPSGELAAKELVHELAEYLSRRYPTVYSVQRQPPKTGDFGWYNEGQICTITIAPVGVTYDLITEDPMKVAGLLTQDDLALMVEGSDGRYYFQAGSICTAGFWRLTDKIGLPLEEIHTRGKVPQYETKLHYSMARFFSKMRLDKPVIRNNYFFQIVRPPTDPSRQAQSPVLAALDPDELSWSDTTNGREDVFDQSTKEPLPDAQASGEAHFQPPKPITDATFIRFRTERQSLRRLPRSGAIVFTIRTYLDPIIELAKEPGIPGRMASAIRSWPEDVALYKGQALYKEAILPYLDQCHDEQLAAGIVTGEDRTSKYPF